MTRKTAVEIVRETVEWFQGERTEPVQAKRKTAVEIVRETREWYRTHPRATVGRKCIYFRPEDGAMCAVGRVLLAPEAWRHQEGGVLALAAETRNTYNTLGSAAKVLDMLLRPKYRGFPITFWAAIQNFHDTRSYWKARPKGGNFLTKAFGHLAYTSLLAQAKRYDRTGVWE